MQFTQLYNTKDVHIDTSTTHSHTLAHTSRFILLTTANYYSLVSFNLCALCNLHAARVHCALVLHANCYQTRSKENNSTWFGIICK